MKKRLSRTLIVPVIICCFITVVSAKSFNKHGFCTYWWRTILNEKISGHQGLIHTVWEKHQEPYGELDYIRLHKVSMRTRARNKPAIVMLPGTWQAGGWSAVTAEEINTMIYLAKRGYDVYTVDYRSSNIPHNDYAQFAELGIDISSTADWTYDVYLKDIKSAVDKIKQISRTPKIFMSGFSRGGMIMFYYAARHPYDLKGLVSLDGGIKDVQQPGIPMDEATYNAVTALFKAGALPDPQTGDFVPWVFNYIEQGYENWKLAGVLPYAKTLAGEPLPAEFDVISDYIADQAYHLWDYMGLGEGVFSNYYGDMIDRDVLITISNEFTRFHPSRHYLEDMQLLTQDDVAYLDYDDATTNLPVIAFLTKVYCPHTICLNDQIPNLTTSDDVTIIYLENYGHMDVLFGKNSIVDVKQPLFDWLEAHR